MVEKEFDAQAYQAAFEYIELITELVVNCEELAQPRYDQDMHFESQLQFANLSPVKPIFVELWPHLK